jgi:hypothetical protein
MTTTARTADLRFYLLGLLQPHEATELEMDSFGTQGCRDAIEDAEIDLMTARIFGQLPPKEAAAFDDHFLLPPQRRDAFSALQEDVRLWQSLLSHRSFTFRRAVLGVLHQRQVSGVFTAAFEKLAGMIAINPFTTLPQPAAAGSFADADPHPFEHSQRFADGTAVRLEEARTHELHLVVSTPAMSGHGRLKISLAGETGAILEIVVNLVRTGEYLSGRAEVGLLPDIRERLGNEIAILVASTPSA